MQSGYDILVHPHIHPYIHPYNHIHHPKIANLMSWIMIKEKQL